jgi:hypothetical protein
MKSYEWLSRVLHSLWHQLRIKLEQNGEEDNTHQITASDGVAVNGFVGGASRMKNPGWAFAESDFYFCYYLY